MSAKQWSRALRVSVWVFVGALVLGVMTGTVPIRWWASAILFPSALPRTLEVSEVPGAERLIEQLELFREANGYYPDHVPGLATEPAPHSEDRSTWTLRYRKDVDSYILYFGTYGLLYKFQPGYSKFRKVSG